LNCWSILEIPPTTDIGEIRKAYSRQAKLHHPEDDPYGFIEVRDAYNQAIRYARGYTADISKLIIAETIEHDEKADIRPDTGHIRVNPIKVGDESGQPDDSIDFTTIDELFTEEQKKQHEQEVALLMKLQREQQRKKRDNDLFLIRKEQMWNELRKIKNRRKISVVCTVMAIIIFISSLCIMTNNHNSNKNLEKQSQQSRGILYMEGISNKPVSGSWSENTWAGAYTGLKFVMPDGWVNCTGQKKDESLNVQKASAVTYIDMFSEDVNTGSSVIVLYEIIPVIYINQESGTGISAGDFNDLRKAANTDINSVYSTGSNTKICGQLYAHLIRTLSGNDSGYEQHYFTIRINEFYMMLIVITLDNGETLNNILACFK